MNDSYENKSNLNGFDEVTPTGRESESVHPAETAQTAPVTEALQETKYGTDKIEKTNDFLTESSEYHFKGMPYEDPEPAAPSSASYGGATENTSSYYNIVGESTEQSTGGAQNTWNSGGAGYGYNSTAQSNTGYTGYGYHSGGYTPYTSQSAAGQQTQNAYSASGHGGTGYTGQTAHPGRTVTPKKNKKKFGGGTVFFSGLCTAILGGMLSAAIMFYGVMPNYTANSGDSGTPATQINVDTTANSTTEAIAQKVGPSVVGIRTTASYSMGFFGEQESSGEGSGIIYSADGYIITNYHVIQSATGSGGTNASIDVYLPNDTETAFPATVIGYDATADLAVIKIEKTGLTPIELGDSDALKVGELAVAIGNPGGLDFMGSVSAGIISGLNRTIQLENSAGTEMNLLQTDAAINPGNSGGALVNAQGQLIGVNSAKLASDGFEGMGFAIPSNSMVEICNNIIENKDNKVPYVGIEVSTQYTAETLTAMGYPAGLVVANVVENGPAANAGIQQSDIITEFNGTEVTTFDAFNDLKNKCKPGDTVTLTVYRLGQYYDVPLTLGETV